MSSNIVVKINHIRYRDVLYRIGSCWSPVQTLPVAPLWCDLGLVPNSCGNKAAANLSPTEIT